MAGGSGTLHHVKLWYHVIAAIVGLAISALIVYAVFGSASEEGATQEGSAGALSASESLCGTVAPSEVNSEATRKLAHDNLPVLSDATGPIPSISSDKPAQVAWFDRLHAAAGLCLDEVKLEDTGTTLSMSTVEGVTEAEAGVFAAGAIAQAFSPPLNRPKVTLVATIDGSERTVVVTKRAWNAFQISREARNLPLTMHSLAQFKQASAFGPSELRVVGWR